MTEAKREVTRRKFLKEASLGAIGMGAALSALGDAAFGDQNRAGESKVIGVKSDDVWKGRKLIPAKVGAMLEKGMLAFMGKDSIADAWKVFVSADDIVGIKINPIGGRRLSTHKELVSAIVNGLMSAGVKQNNIIVWDRFEQHLVRAGYKLNKRSEGIRCYGTEFREDGSDDLDRDVFYESDKDNPEKRDADGKKSFFSKILTKHITALVNVPVLKDHIMGGVTFCLKNLAFGAVNNTQRFHDSQCDPMIAEVFSRPEIKSKLRLNIADALQACFDGGPTSMRPNTMWKENTIFLGADPVAIDKIGWDIIEAKRKPKRKRPIGQRARHIITAAEMGLGQVDMGKIDLVMLSV